MIHFCRMSQWDAIEKFQCEIRGKKSHADQAAKDGSLARATRRFAAKVKGLVYGTPAGQNSSTWYPFLDGTSTGRIGRERIARRGARGMILAVPFMGKANDHREIGTRIAGLCSSFNSLVRILSNKDGMRPRSLVLNSMQLHSPRFSAVSS